jgi:hypothetical protein
MRRRARGAWPECCLWPQLASALLLRKGDPFQFCSIPRATRREISPSQLRSREGWTPSGAPEKQIASSGRFVRPECARESLENTAFRDVCRKMSHLPAIRHRLPPEIRLRNRARWTPSFDRTDLSEFTKRYEGSFLGTSREIDSEFPSSKIEKRSVFLGPLCRC